MTELQKELQKLIDKIWESERDNLNFCMKSFAGGMLDLKARVEKLEESCEVMAKRVFGFDKPAKQACEKQSKWEVGQRVRIYDSSAYDPIGIIVGIDNENKNIKIKTEVDVDWWHMKQCRRLKKKS